MASLMQWLRGDTTPIPVDEVDALRGELDATRLDLELLAEAAVDAERILAAEDEGWARIGEGVAGQFTRQQLRDITARCRLGQWNALIGRGLELRTAYVHGSGVTISARAAGPSDEKPQQQDVNGVVQAFLDHPGNQATLTGQQGREEGERALGTDGQFFIAHFTNPVTGAVRVRDLPWDQIEDVVYGDDGDPQFYRRQWTDVPPGESVGVRRTVFYPALGYRPTRRPSTVGGHPVQWDAPVLHVLVNRPTKQAKFGVPDAYTAVAWARAYRDFLTDWALLVKALSKLAFKATSKGSTQAKVRAGMATATTATAPVGQTASLGPDTKLEAISKSGATIDSDSGRPLAAMVAAALGVPVTMLLADPGVTGARATADTLDRPTELTAGMRRTLWTQVYATVLGYVIDQAVLAPRGRLRGAVTLDDFDREVVVLAGDTDRSVQVDWPDLTETPVEVLMAAIATADGLRAAPPPLVLARAALQVLGVEDVDEVLEQMTDEQGNYVPQLPAAPAPAVPAVPEPVPPVE